MPHILEVDNLVKKFGEHTAVKGVSFEVDEGEMVQAGLVRIECVRTFRLPDVDGRTVGFVHVHGELRFTEPEGAYYVMVDVSEFGCPSDTAFCEWLIREVGVATVPGSSFFREPENRYIRFHFAKKEETLVAAGGRLLGLRDKAARAATW